MALLERLIEDVGDLTVGEVERLKQVLDAAWDEVRAMDAAPSTPLKLLDSRAFRRALIEATTDLPAVEAALSDPDTRIRQAAARRLRQLLGATDVDIPDLVALSDVEVLALVKSMMPEEDVERWRDLRDARHERALTPEEEAAFQQLEAAYWLGQYTRTEAMIEAKQRGIWAREG